jgi:hypothetical protein
MLWRLAHMLNVLIFLSYKWWHVFFTFYCKRWCMNFYFFCNIGVFKMSQFFFVTLHTLQKNIAKWCCISKFALYTQKCCVQIFFGAWPRVFGNDVEPPIHVKVTWRSMLHLPCFMSGMLVICVFHLLYMRMGGPARPCKRARTGPGYWAQEIGQDGPWFSATREEASPVAWSLMGFSYNGSNLGWFFGPKVRSALSLTGGSIFPVFTVRDWWGAFRWWHLFQ